MLGCLPRYFMLVTARGKDENPKLSDVIKYANIAIINKPLEIEEVGDHIISAQTNEDTYDMKESAGSPKYWFQCGFLFPLKWVIDDAIVTDAGIKSTPIISLYKNRIGDHDIMVWRGRRAAVPGDGDCHIDMHTSRDRYKIVSWSPHLIQLMCQLAV